MANNTGKKFGGRKAGVKNKRSLAAAEVLKDEKFDALRTMVRLCRDAEAEGDTAEAGRLAAQIARYQFPQLKAIEHSTQGGGVSIKWSTGVPDQDPLPAPDKPTTSGGMTASDLQQLIESQ